MLEIDDNQLLREFAAQGSETAFAELVRRHVNLVYSVGLRQTGNPHHAEEITQAVFIILARKAGSLGRKTILSGWIYQTARLTAANFQRTERRRAAREQEVYMQSLSNDPALDVWPKIAPLLDDAMAKLGQKDRDAIALRFFEGKSLNEVGTALGTSEDAAKMRVNRALEKLRMIFSKRGVTLAATVLGGTLAANSVQAAPIGLAVTVSAATAKGTVVSASILILVKGTLKMMTWIKAKTAIAVGVGVVIATGGAAAAYETIWRHPDWTTGAKLESAPPTLIIRPSRFKSGQYPSGGNMGTQSGKWVETGVDVSSLLTLAYGFGQSRMVLPAEMPAGTYDLMLTLPDQQREALREELKKQFGLTARKETRETDVLLLKIRDFGKLKAHGTKDGNPGLDHGRLVSRIFDLQQSLEGFLTKPILDRTGADNDSHYNFNYDFLYEKARPADAKMKYLQQNLLEPFGLELVPGRDAIEVLVVERVKP
jgi:uncharacterized protein (TIGR03435 family)